jgi:hypothetical protein
MFLEQVLQTDADYNFIPKKSDRLLFPGGPQSRVHLHFGFKIFTDFKEHIQGDIFNFGTTNIVH